MCRNTEDGLAAPIIVAVCAGCGKVRTTGGNWAEPAEIQARGRRTLLTHTFCPRCMRRMYSYLKF